MGADPTVPGPPDAPGSTPDRSGPTAGESLARGGASDPVAGGAVTSTGARAGLGEHASRSLGDLAERLAGGGPTPGAGSGLAAGAALGAALVAKAFHRSARDGASPVTAYMQGRALRLEALASELLRLVDADAEAYRGFLDARNASQADDAARAKRRAALERAARAVVEVPFELLEACLAALRLAAVGAPDQHPNLACETEAGALLLHATVEGAARIVRENLPVAAAESAAFADMHARALPAQCREAATLLDEVRRATAPRES